MEKFKKYLAVVIKYHFWIICGLMLLVALACWWPATANLAAQFAARKTKLEQAFGSVRIPPNPPNQGVIDKIKQQNDALKGTVYKAWQTLYLEQKKNNPLPPVLSDDFKQQFENLKPKEELKPANREHYQTFIAGYVPTLLKLIDARRPADNDVRAGAAGGTKDGRGPSKTERKSPVGPAPVAGGQANPAPAGATPDAAAEQAWIGTVEWNKSDYDALVHQFEWSEPPSTLAIVLAQEDLWVYEALARVVRRANEGATGHANAAVKKINALEIGQNAVKAWKAAEGSILSLASATGVPPAAPPPSVPGAVGAGTSGVNEEAKRQQLMADRYVDDKGKPLPYTPEYPYAKHPCDEFKRMPIHLSFIMNPRSLPKLLVECANSTMPIEVQHIRILKGASHAGTGGTASQPSGSTASKAGEGEGSPASSDDREADICGVIYIYNPPDRAKLGVAAAADAAVPPPAAAPAPVATPANPAATPANPAVPAATPAAPAGKAPAAAPAASPAAAAPPATAPAAPAATAVPAAPPAGTPGKPSKP